MFLRTLAIKTIVIAAVALASADSASAAGLASAIAECEPGAAAQLPENQVQGPRETPLTLPGVVTVSPYEAKCLMNKLGKELVVVAAVDDERKLPGAVPMSWAAANDPEVQELLAGELATLTKGSKSRPLLVYCHHAACGLSPKVAQRMVTAGYAHVYWLRSGMDGWKKAELAFAGEVEQDPAKRYAALVGACDADLDAESIAGIVAGTPPAEVEGKIASELADEQEDRRSCLQGIVPKVTEGKRHKADLAQRIARSDAEVARMMKAARAAFDANPAGELVPRLNRVDVNDLRDTIGLASSAPSLASRCGYYDFSIPHMTNAVLDGMKQRLDAYRSCMDQLEQETRFKAVYPSGFRSAVVLAERTRPYTCSASHRPNCVPDDVWARVGRVATRDQLQVVERGSEAFDQLPGAMEAMRARLNAHVDAVNARVADINEQRERSDSGSYSYPDNSYAPPPVPYRAPSNASAAGIR